MLKRATVVINAAIKLNCRRFVKENTIVNGNARLNLLFLCHCFRMYPCLEKHDRWRKEVEKGVAETTEEKTFRNWINSLAVEPFVSDLHHELEDGWVLLQVLHTVRNPTSF